MLSISQSVSQSVESVIPVCHQVSVACLLLLSLSLSLPQQGLFAFFIRRVTRRISSYQAACNTKIAIVRSGGENRSTAFLTARQPGWLGRGTKNGPVD